MQIGIAGLHSIADQCGHRSQHRQLSAIASQFKVRSVAMAGDDRRWWAPCRRHSPMIGVV